MKTMYGSIAILFFINAFIAIAAHNIYIAALHLLLAFNYVMWALNDRP